jgi:hypothetical protein
MRSRSRLGPRQANAVDQRLWAAIPPARVTTTGKEHSPARRSRFARRRRPVPSTRRSRPTPCPPGAAVPIMPCRPRPGRRDPWASSTTRRQVERVLGAVPWGRSTGRAARRSMTPTLSLLPVAYQSPNHFVAGSPCGWRPASRRPTGRRRPDRVGSGGARPPNPATAPTPPPPVLLADNAVAMRAALRGLPEDNGLPLLGRTAAGWVIERAREAAAVAGRGGQRPGCSAASPHRSCRAVVRPALGSR